MSEANVAIGLDHQHVHRAELPYQTYPAGWVMAPDMRIRDLKGCFPTLDFSHVEELAARYCSSDGKLVLPQGMEGLAIIPKIEALAKLMKSPPRGWPSFSVALRVLVGILNEVHSGDFSDCAHGLLEPELNRLYAPTESALAQDAINTPGDVHVVAVQTGQLFAGYSSCAVKVLLEESPRHLGLPCVGGGALMLAYPERFVKGTLWMSCPGSEAAPRRGFPFDGVTIWGGDNQGQRGFAVGYSCVPMPFCGPATFVLPG